MITVTIPSESASRSKMQRKGWKCWAKWLSNIKTPANDGYAFEGEFTSPGTTVEAEVGDVLLHVDQSSGADLMVLMVNRTGKSFLKSVADANSEGRKWCGPLAAPARRLLDMDREARIRWVGQFILDQPRDTPLKDEDRAYWQTVAGTAPESAQPEPTAVDIAAIVDQINALLSPLTDEQVAEVYRRLPGVEHKS